MKLYDISQELTACAVYPGSPGPKTERISDMAHGDLYNLTCLSLSAHNGTHIDAPFHFFADGKTVDAIPLEKTVGPCFVFCHHGDFTACEVRAILAQKHGKFPKRLLLCGKATVTADAAKMLAEIGIDLIGCESQTVGPERAPMEVHKILLAQEVVLLEGLRLAEVEEGDYFLCAAPLNIGGSDGSPCRAVLIAF